MILYLAAFINATKLERPSSKVKSAARHNSLQLSSSKTNPKKCRDKAKSSGNGVKIKAKNRVQISLSLLIEKFNDASEKATHQYENDLKVKRRTK